MDPGEKKASIFLLCPEHFGTKQKKKKIKTDLHVDSRSQIFKFQHSWCWNTLQWELPCLSLHLVTHVNISHFVCSEI